MNEIDQNNIKRNNMSKKKTIDYPYNNKKRHNNKKNVNNNTIYNNGF